MVIRVLYFDGITGAGKTVGMSFFALAEMQAGKTIYANYDLAFSTRIQQSDLVETLYSLEHSEVKPKIAADQTPKVICLDEIHTMWDSYRSMADSALDLGYFADQHRKLRADIFYTSQHPERIPKSLRRITTDICLCESIPPNDKENPLAFRYTFQNRFDSAISEVVIPASVMKTIYPLYRTYQRIIPQKK